MMSSCWQITFDGAPDDIPAWEEFLDAFFEVNACNYADDGRGQYVGYLSKPFNETELRAAARQAGLTLPPFEVELLESSNWLKDYVIQFPPFEVADFLIYGIHESAAPQTDKIPLQIYAATAFGSDHQTTRSCLQAVSDLYHKGFKPQQILDVGTGSGILSLASGKLWPKARLTAVDIDQEAVWVTESNAANNSISLTAAVSDGYAAAEIRNNTPFDLILANILARPLIAMAPDMAQNLKPGGCAVISGFVGEQAGWVLSEHLTCGLQLVRLYELDNWRAALLQKV